MLVTLGRGDYLDVGIPSSWTEATWRAVNAKANTETKSLVITAFIVVKTIIDDSLDKELVVVLIGFKLCLDYFQAVLRCHPTFQIPEIRTFLFCLHCDVTGEVRSV